MCEYEFIRCAKTKMRTVGGYFEGNVYTGT